MLRCVNRNAAKLLKVHGSTGLYKTFRPAAAVLATALSNDAGSNTKNIFLYPLLTALALLSLGTETEAEAMKPSLHSKMDCTSCKPDRYSVIVVGGGTAGCTTAYLSAKWMQDNGIKGQVLLIDKGVDFFDAKAGPNPLMKAWFENWGIYGDAHPALREDGSAYPVTGSDHRGVGGCGTHDTRITFQPTAITLQRLASMMGWTDERTRCYYQAALNLMPVIPAISPEEPEAFYQAVLAALPRHMRAPGDHFCTNIRENSLALSSIAAYPNEVRWTSAYLLHPSVRPSNLEVVTLAAVDKVVIDSIDINNGSIDSKDSGAALAAKGVVVVTGQGAEAKSELVYLDEHGEVVLTGGAFGATAVLQRSGVGPKAALQAAGVEKVLVNNSEVGHGVDHTEIAVLYEWLDKWNDPVTQGPPRGGVMGWPMVAFLPFPDDHNALFPSTEDPPSAFMMGHFGAGYAEPYTDFPTVVCTPNCIRPDLKTGFHATITSTKPTDSLTMVHAEQRADWEAIAKGVLSTVKLMEGLREKGLVGKRLEPTFLEPEKLVEWVRENHFTAFHWACTCQAGLQGRVADHRFRVRSHSLSSTAGEGDAHPRAADGKYGGVIQNLLVGSAAALPELPDANPHLTITAFSFALAEEVVRTQAARRGAKYTTPSELHKAAADVQKSATLQTRAPGQEMPNLARIAEEHYQRWCKAHPVGEQ